jgi:cytochrome c-type biogenesis protein CcmH/NrfG
MKTYREQKQAEKEDFGRFVRSAILVVLGILAMVMLFSYGILHYQRGLNTCIGKGYTRGYCQYLMK